jgi:hypothetical protein
MVRCYVGATRPVAPQIATTGWLGLVTPVWPWYEYEGGF